jgi:hypothetical protein
MNLDEIAFPALIIADDGWVQEIYRKDTLDFGGIPQLQNTTDDV